MASTCSSDICNGLKQILGNNSGFVDAVVNIGLIGSPTQIPSLTLAAQIGLNLKIPLGTNTGNYLFNVTGPSPGLLLIIYLNIPSIDLRAPATPQVDLGLFVSGRAGFSLPFVDLSNSTFYGRLTFKVATPLQLSAAFGVAGTLTLNLPSVPFVVILSNCGISGSGTLTTTPPPVPALTQLGAQGGVQICAKLSDGSCDLTNYVGGEFSFNLDVTQPAQSAFSGTLYTFVSLDKLASIFLGPSVRVTVPNFLAGAGIGPASFALSKTAISASGVVAFPFLFPGGSGTFNGQFSVALSGPPNFLLSLQLPVLSVGGVLSIQRNATSSTVGPSAMIQLTSGGLSTSFGVNVSGYFSLLGNRVQGAASLYMQSSTTLFPPSTSNQFSLHVNGCVANLLLVCLDANAQLDASVVPSLTAPLQLSQLQFNASGVIAMADSRTALAQAVARPMATLATAVGAPLNAFASSLSVNATLDALASDLKYAVSGVLYGLCTSLNFASASDCLSYANAFVAGGALPSLSSAVCTSLQQQFNTILSPVSTGVCSPCGGYGSLYCSPCLDSGNSLPTGCPPFLCGCSSGSTCLDYGPGVLCSIVNPVLNPLCSAVTGVSGQVYSACQNTLGPLGDPMQPFQKSFQTLLDLFGSVKQVVNQAVGAAGPATLLSNWNALVQSLNAISGSSSACPSACPSTNANNDCSNTLLSVQYLSFSSALTSGSSSLNATAFACLNNVQRSVSLSLDLSWNSSQLQSTVVNAVRTAALDALRVGSVSVAAVNAQLCQSFNSLQQFLTFAAPPLNVAINDLLSVFQVPIFGSDWSGYDITNSLSSGWPECRQRCAQTPSCRLWVVRKDDSNRCYLKSGWGVYSPSPSAVAGLSPIAFSLPDSVLGTGKYYDVSGTDIISSTITNNDINAIYATCKGQCVLNSSCTLFVISLNPGTTTQTCWLKKATSGFSYNVLRWSGVPSTPACPSL